MKLTDPLFARPQSRSLDVALVVAGFVLAWVFAYHGAQKLFGWFGGGGIAGTGEYFSSVGLGPGRAWAVLIGLLEVVGAGCVLVGLLTKVFGGLLALEMLGVLVKVNWVNGLVSEKAEGGYEINLTLAALGILLALVGAGLWSLDARVGARVGTPSASLDA